MASKEIEREVEDFVRRCPLKRRSIMDHRRMLPCDKYYDIIWNQKLRELSKEEIENACKAKQTSCKGDI